jgi:hypothetical protein
MKTVERHRILRTLSVQKPADLAPFLRFRRPPIADEASSLALPRRFTNNVTHLGELMAACNTSFASAYNF